MYTESCLRNASIRLTVCCIFLTFAGLFGFASPSSADQKIIKGVPFAISELRPTGAGYTAVVVGGESRLVEDALIDAYIIAQYFKNRDLFLTISTKQIEQFVTQSVRDGDIENATQALKGLFEFGDASSPSVVAFFEELKLEEQAVELFRRLLPDISTSTVSPRILSIMVVTVGLRDLPWLREHMSRVLYTHSDGIREYLRYRIYEHIKDQTIEGAQPLAALMKEIFSSEDPEAKSLQVVLVKLQNLLSGESEDGSDIPLSLSDLAGSDQVLYRYLAPIYVDTIHQRALTAAKEGNPEKSLTLLSLIDLERRTPSTHSLLIAALQAIPADSEILIHNQKIEDFIVFVSEKDSYVREAYIECLERLVDDRIEKGLLIEARGIFNLLSRVRPDPNSLNDSIRIKSAKNLIRAGKIDKANQLLKDAQTGISLINKASIVTLKLFNSPLLIVFVLAALLGIFGILWYAISKVSRPELVLKSDFSDTAEEVERPTFVTSRGRAGGMPHEYIEGLHEFGLTPEAGMKEIKTAFRNRIKDIHPDHQHMHGDNPAEFIRIKDVYERLLEIRKRMGLD